MSQRAKTWWAGCVVAGACGLAAPGADAQLITDPSARPAKQVPAYSAVDATALYLGDAGVPAAQPAAPRGVRAPVTTSLYHAPPVADQRVKGRIVNRVIEHASLTSVPTAEIKEYAVNDLVTILIRERSTATSSSTLETEKEYELNAGIRAIPELQVKDLLNGHINQNQRSAADLPSVAVDSSNEFEGEADYERRDVMEIELQARVIDVKPNGNLVLEARKYIKNDDEELTVKVTGTANPDDIGFDNRVLSTRVFDLRVEKTHNGELRKSTKKGVLTQIFEFIFNF